MARKLVSFAQSTYFKNNSLKGSANLYLITNHLLPGLDQQAEIVAGSRGIPLPVDNGADQEYITIQEAKSLILDYLIQIKGIDSDDQKSLLKIKSEEEFARTASILFSSKAQDPNKLLTAARMENLEAFRAKKIASATTQTKTYDPSTAYANYSKMYFEILKYANSAVVPQKLIADILPPGSSRVTEALLRKQFAAIIVSNLHRLNAAASTGSSDNIKNYQVGRELFNIIRESYPDNTDLLHIVGDEKTSQRVIDLTTSLVKETKASFSLDEYERARSLAATSLPEYLLNHTELKAEIKKSLPNLSVADQSRLADAVIKETIASSVKGSLDYDQIITLVGQKLQLDATTTLNIKHTLANRGLDVSIEYLQNQKAVQFGEYRFTQREWGLVRSGVDPTLFIRSEHKVANTEKSLLAAQSTLLATYNSKNNTAFTTLFDAYQAERNKPKDQIDVDFVIKSRRLNGDISYYQDLTPQEKAQIGRARFGRRVLDYRSRFYEAQGKIIDGWIDFEETITGKKLLHKVFDSWDEIAEKVTIPGTKIPLFRIAPWLADRWDEWKKASTLKWIADGSTRYKGWKIVADPLRPVINWSLKYYEMGNFTVNGATTAFATRQWGKFVKWGLTKVGLSDVGKYVGIQAGRATTRFLIKIGGKTLAKIGSKAIAAIATSGTIIGTIIFVGSLVLDLLSLGWNFLKKFFKDGKFRETVVGWGLAISGFFTAINIGRVFTGIFAGLGLIFGGLFALTLSSLLLAMTIIGFIWFINTSNLHSSENDARLDVNLSLDSGVGEFIGSILCDSGEGGGKNNTRIQTAACIAEILSECGINPLNAGNVKGTKWQCALASTLAQSALAELEYSASKYEVLQCVGFVSAIDAATGGSSHFTTAKYLPTIVPAGYKFAAGVGSCSPGDFFVDTTGADGHVGLFIANGGATIQCADANGGGPGVVRGPDKCQWLSSKVAGCLKKI